MKAVRAWLLRAACALVIGWFAVPAALAQGRVALVVGAGAYRAVPALANPPRDARSMAEALRRAGFQTELLLDPDRERLEQGIRRLGAAARRADVILFFYAGHALEFNGTNYLVPVTARIASARDLPFEGVSLDLLAGQIEGARTALIFLDACRDNPLALRLGRGERGLGGRGLGGRGLAPPSAAGTGTLIAYATAPGQTAADGGGGHSPFTQALLANIGTPGLEIRQLLGRVRRDVREATDGRQIPWESSALEGDFYFYPPAAGTPAAPSPPPAPRAAEPPRSLPQTALALPPAPLPPTNTAHYCPAPGFEAVLSDGSTVHFDGSEPGHPAICRLEGGRSKAVFGIWDADDPAAPKVENALVSLWGARPGSSEAFDDLRTNSFWHGVWTYVGDESLVVRGATVTAAHMSYLRETRGGTYSASRTEYWFDRANGMPLRKRYEFVAGIRYFGTNFDVVSIRRTQGG